MSTNPPNIDVTSNIWICIHDPNGLGNNPHAASKAMPGDLAFKILVPHMDIRIIEQAVLDGTVTKKQVKERDFYRHTAPHNHLDDPNVAKGLGI